MPASDQRGFTLVELMVVVTVIALASAAVVWAMPDPRGRVMDEAARFATRVRAAHEEAVVGAHPVSLWVTAAGYGFDQRVGGGWIPASDGPLHIQQWQPGTRAALAEARTRLTFDETGLADRPLDVAIVRDRRTAHIRIAPDGSVRIDG